MNNANNATRLGIYFFKMLLLITVNSSSKAGDYDTCNAENAIDHCLKCNADLHRILKINETGSYCSCYPGYIDISFTCYVCHYTW